MMVLKSLESENIVNNANIKVDEGAVGNIYPWIDRESEAGHTIHSVPGKLMLGSSKKTSPTRDGVDEVSADKEVLPADDSNTSVLARETSAIVNERTTNQDYTTEPINYSDAGAFERDQSGSSGSQPEHETHSALSQSESSSEDMRTAENQVTVAKQDIVTNKSIEETQSGIFKVKSITWRDLFGQTRTSPIIMQNLNGPCPLLALINTLILSTRFDDDNPLSRISTDRTEISAKYLLELLGDYLLSSEIAERSDIARVLELLPSLHTGLNINPRFDGTFEDSEELALFRAFDVDIVHGWLSDHSNEYFHDALMKATSYEGAQALLLESADLTAKLKSEKSLTSEEVEIVERARLVDAFLTSSATQLTQHGLSFLSELLSSGSFAIFFRNDHFSTIYKHPESNQLFMLVTDAGYIGHQNIVWESLNDITGSGSEFYNGFFVPSEFENMKSAKQLNQAQKVNQSSSAVGGPMIINSRFHDEDYVLAMQLQMDMDQELAREQQRIYDEDSSRRNTAQRKQSFHGSLPTARRNRQQGASTTNSRRSATTVTASGKTKKSTSGSDKCIIM
ncbi:hypothetical protein V1511DRAFT_484251 [Dipodascopsis uninucleata]